MHIRKGVCLTLLAVLSIATRAVADPLLITGGYIQTYGNGTSFIFQVNDQRWFSGDTEGTGFPPLFLAGNTGDTVNLSSSVNTALTGFSIADPIRQDLAARADFTFNAGDALLPGGEAVRAAPNGLGLLAAPFTFTGTLFVYPTYAAMVAGEPPAWQYALRGTGAADAMLSTSLTGNGQPIVSYSGVYTFSVDTSAAAVPEPGTLLLVGSGAAAFLARRRKQAE